MRDDLRAGIVQQLRRDAADVAEPLDGHARAFERHAAIAGTPPASTNSTPRPVASTRPLLPPIVTGLPVTTAGTEWPCIMLYVSMIHAMICASVPMSGAGTSSSGPISMPISAANRRVIRSSSRRLSARGSTITPPFAPPYGSPATAHFHVIHIESARTSSSETFGL